MGTEFIAQVAKIVPTWITAADKGFLSALIKHGDYDVTFISKETHQKVKVLLRRPCGRAAPKLPIVRESHHPTLDILLKDVLRFLLIIKLLFNTDANDIYQNPKILQSMIDLLMNFCAC